MSRSTSEPKDDAGDAGASAPASPGTCDRCGRALESSVVCLECGALLATDERDPFRAFGLERRLDVDPTAVRKKLLRLQRATHPDFHATSGPAARAAAEEAASALNAAHEVLSDRQRLADWLVRALGGPTQDDERQMPQEFLMEVLEWNEVLDEARGSDAPDGEALSALAAALRSARQEALDELTAQLAPLPDAGSPRLVAARRQLNALRYVDRALSEVDALTD